MGKSKAADVGTPFTLVAFIHALTVATLPSQYSPTEKPGLAAVLYIPVNLPA